MRVAVNVPEELRAKARARGVPLEVYVEEMLAQQALDATEETRLVSAGVAFDRIVEFRKGNKLAGLSIKDLIHEGHRLTFTNSR
jgi:hypothetical protein